jgi:hypothetical protein
MARPFRNETPHSSGCVLVFLDPMCMHHNLLPVVWDNRPEVGAIHDLTANGSSCVRWGFWLITVLLASSALGANADSSALKVSGVLEFRLLRGALGGDSEPVTVVNFEGLVGVNGWKIRTASKAFWNDYFEVAHDGTNTYYLSSFTNWFQTQVAAGKEIPANVGTGIVRKSPVPVFPFAHHAGAIWLAYCSPPYFQGLGSKFAESPATVGSLQGQTKNPDFYGTQPVSVSMSSAHPAWPEEVIYHATNHMSRAVYRLVSTTNVAGTVYPASAFFQIFGQDIANPEQSVVWDYQIAATHYSKVELPPNHDWRPAVPGPISIAEVRFSAPTTQGERFKPFSYWATNQWLSDEEVKQLPVYQQRLAEVMARKPKPWRTAFAMFAVLIAASAPWLLRRRFISEPKST